MAGSAVTITCTIGIRSRRGGRPRGGGTRALHGWMGGAEELPRHPRHSLGQLRPAAHSRPEARERREGSTRPCKYGCHTGPLPARPARP